MVTITTTSCPPCEGTGWIHGPDAQTNTGKGYSRSPYRRYMCACCCGAGRIQERRTVPSVEIGHGPDVIIWPPGIAPVTQQQEAEWHMLAAALGNREV